MRLDMAPAEMKAWAFENLKGIENCTFPSFTPDLSELDEAGIRWDVDMAKQHGFRSTLCVAESGMTSDEAKRFVSIVADEAGDDLLVSTTALFDSVAQNRAMIEHAAAVGCDRVLLGYPPNYYPQTVDEIESLTRQMAAAGHIGISVYPSHKFNFGRFDPSGFPLAMLERLSDIDNVVAIEVALLEPGFIFECFRRCADRVLVQCPWERWLPLLNATYDQQWMGPGAYELFQSPDKPHLVTYFDLMLAGEMDAAMEIYWQLTPVRMVFEKQFMPTQGLGSYNWPQQKYYQWLVGGNGGYTRQPTMKMYQHDMDEARNVLRAVDIEPRMNDNEFYVGRANYQNM